MTEKQPDGLAQLLTQLPDMLSRVHRWTHFSSLPRVERETVLEHSYASVLLVGAMLALEEAQGMYRGQWDHGRLLLAAALHDAGEGRIGDVSYSVKQDPRVREPLEQIEREQVERMLRDVPDAVREQFLSAYRLVDTDTLEGRFFKAVERMGYIQYAVRQVRQGRMEFLEVFRIHHEQLLKLETEFVSVNVLYAPYRGYVEEELRRETVAPLAPSGNP